MRDELAERGYAELTVDGVARRAGTSKSVLYRRYPSKAHLVLGALVGGFAAETALPDTGSLRGDLLALVAAVNTRIEATGPETFRGLLAETPPAELPELTRSVTAWGAEWLAGIHAAARRRGEMPDEPPPPRVAMLPITLLRHAMVFEGGLDEDERRQIIDEVCLPLLTAGAPATRRPSRVRGAT